MSDAAATQGSARVDLGALWVAPPLLALVVLFLYPLTLIAHADVYDASDAFDLAAAWQTLYSRAFVSALLNTAEIALAATAGSLALGLVFALVIAFVPVPGATFIAKLIDTFIALPTFPVTLAFTFLYG